MKFAPVTRAIAGRAVAIVAIFWSLLNMIVLALVDYSINASGQYGNAFSNAFVPVYDIYYITLGRMNPFENQFLWPWLPPGGSYALGVALYAVVAAGGIAYLRARASRLQNAFALLGLLSVMVFIFEVGIFFLCPGYRNIHVTNLQSTPATAWFTNDDLLFASLVVFAIITAYSRLRLARLKESTAHARSL